MIKHPLTKKYASGKFVFMSLEDVIRMSGAFMSIWSEQDGDVTFLHKFARFLNTIQLLLFFFLVFMFLLNL